jgi:SAM-dependent methyltransferase
MSDEKVIEQVRSQYANVANSTLGNDSDAVRAVAAAFGYSEEELNGLPRQANMGLSCGNPLALAGITPGETVLDLGCGGGMDLFLAAKQVGPSGKAIGVDMTPEMLARAEAGRSQLGIENIEFHQASIDHLPLADGTVDCVISNCVINLAPDKLSVFREIRRVLKPGGRVAMSDIALRQSLPEEVKASVEAYVGCISGALLIPEYRQLLEQAGFSSIVITDTGADLNAYAQASSGCCGTDHSPSAGSSTSADSSSSLHNGLAHIMRTFDANAYAASVRVHAISPSQDELS